MYLKVSLISVCPVHMGGEAERSRPPAAPPPLGSAAGREALGSAPRSAGVSTDGGAAAGGLSLPGHGGCREPSSSAAAAAQMKSRRRRRAGSRHSRAAGMALRHGLYPAGRPPQSAPTCAERGDRALAVGTPRPAVRCHRSRRPGTEPGRCLTPDGDG